MHKAWHLALPANQQQSRPVVRCLQQCSYRHTALISWSFDQPPHRFQIDRRKYHPVPQVHGAVVEFALRPEGQRPAVPSERGFLTLVGWVAYCCLYSFSLV